MSDALVPKQPRALLFVDSNEIASPRQLQT